ncbi:MAG: proline racemase family protein [Rhodoferax sp.]|nr:proline racemase family protein [Rhodoferax sp.]
MNKIHCLDSHTGGEPTRLVVGGFPDLGGLPLADAVRCLRTQHDHYRRAVVCEPRGSDVLVGALLLAPIHAQSLASVIFFNNVGYLGMCGHGTIGLMATLEHLGRVTPGSYAIDTPVGTVQARLHGQGRVSVENVRSYRHLASVTLNVDGYGRVVGDVAWGGNWFFLLDAGSMPLTLANVDALTRFAQAVRQALRAQGVTGRDGAEIDHIELMGPAHVAGHDGRNFVLCPGGAFDRSPCGTGTSAKLACLAADGKLAKDATWRQESVIGSVFDARFRPEGEQIIPTITGQAFLSGELTLLLDPADPLCWGTNIEPRETEDPLSYQP